MVNRDCGRGALSAASVSPCHQRRSCFAGAWACYPEQWLADLLVKLSSSSSVDGGPPKPRKRRKKSEPAYYSPIVSSSHENRERRRQLIAQHRIVWRGPPNEHGVTLHCGRFSDEYIDALKDSSLRAGRIVYNSCCKGGKISIPPFQRPPDYLAKLVDFNGDAPAKKFIRNIRQYNCLFAFTSMGANIDRSMNDGRGPPIFKISGQVHHRIGSLVPSDGKPPQYIQLYIYDTANEVKNRMQALDPDERNSGRLDPTIVQGLLDMLDAYNPFAQKFRMARDRLQDYTGDEFVIRIVGAKEGDPLQYSMPTTEHLAMLVVGDFSLETFKRDIVIQTRDGHLRQISALHPAFMALQYPLLFPYGERGFQVGVLYTGANPNDKSPRVKMTMQDYYRYMFHCRKNQSNPYLCYGAASSQARVDARACIDESRLWFVIKNQARLRVENLQGIADAVGRGCIDGNEVGKRTVLPSSHTGGRRYMIQNYHDAIAICRVYGPPDFFTTFTCNSKWPEISEALLLEPGQKSSDRADIVDRVYNMKLEDMLDDIKTGKAFGPVDALLHTVEFQKRGLPHAHIILWVSRDTSQPTPALIDSFISAEIPDPAFDPLAYALVAEHMIHGPCGVGYEGCPCMKDDSDGYAVYKRQKIVLTVASSGIPCDLDDGAVCDIKRGTMLAELIQMNSPLWSQEMIDCTWIKIPSDLLLRTEALFAMAFDLLPVLNPRGKHWTVCVRVSRLWEYRGGTDTGDIAHLDLVLLDKEGNAMYAEIPASEVEAKRPLLEEGGVYIISRFRVSNAKSFYRPVDAKYMVEFTCYTKVS
ncbi:hypothetical protein ACP4OV_017852 [Aristida adscensionis]